MNKTSDVDVSLHTITFILRLVEHALVRIFSPIDYLVTFFQILAFVLDIMFKSST
jgi:hypothetical protein